MKDIFNHYYQLSETEIKELWDKCIFIFDTNVLLDLYRLPENASSDLLKILADSKINNRVWLPFQIGLEYQENRLSVISEQVKKFEDVKKIIDNKKIELNTFLNGFKTQLDELQLKERHSRIKPDKYINSKLLAKTFKILANFEKELKELKTQQLDINLYSGKYLSMNKS